MHQPRGWARLVIVLASFVSQVAAAQPPLGSVQEKPTQEELLGRGVRLRREGQDAEALAVFQLAYALSPTPRAVGQLALAHQALGHWQEAERDFMEALRSETDEWVVRNRAYLEDGLATTQANLAWLEVHANVTGAEVLIEGRMAGRLPLDGPTRIAAGEVTVEVRAPGYSSMRRTVRVDGGARLLAEFALAPQPTLVPPASDRPEPTHLSGDRAPVRRDAGWIALAGAGGLALVGIGAAVTREWEAHVYNDDSQCGPLPGQPRSLRCGSTRDIVSVAQTVAIGAFVGAGVAGTVAGFLLLRRSPAPPPLSNGRVRCEMAGTGFACRGVF